MSATADVIAARFRPDAVARQYWDVYDGVRRK
jgi:hypothetical protein